MAKPAERISFTFLSIAPFVIVPLAGIRSLRVSGVYQPVGAVLFVAIVAAASTLGLRALRGSDADRARAALSGALLLIPFAAVALLWIGLGTPWDATPDENVMRYAVLLGGAIAVNCAFVVLRDALRDAGEHLTSAVGFATNVLAGSAYVVWLSFQLGAHAMRAAQGKVPDSLRALDSVMDTLLFAACALTYLSVASYAHSMGRVRWLGRGAAATYVVLNLALLAFLTIRGLSFPDPTQLATPWYLRPGFVAGIPAVPWVMPFLLGVQLLRRSSGEAAVTHAADVAIAS